MSRALIRLKTGRSIGNEAVLVAGFLAAFRTILLLIRLLVSLVVLAFNWSSWPWKAYSWTLQLQQPWLQYGSPLYPVQWRRPWTQFCVQRKHTFLERPQLYSSQGTSSRSDSESCSALLNKEEFMKDEYNLKQGTWDFERFTHDYYEYEQGQTLIIVRGRLRQNISFWKSIGANCFVLDIIQNAFLTTSPLSLNKNNKSTLLDPDFVCEAIQDL